jgi:hypothetical protein
MAVPAAPKTAYTPTINTKDAKGCHSPAKPAHATGSNDAAATT